MVEELLNDYPEYSNEELSLKYGLKVTKIKQIAKENNVKKSKEYLAKAAQERNEKRYQISDELKNEFISIYLNNSVRYVCEKLQISDKTYYRIIRRFNLERRTLEQTNKQRELSNKSRGRDLTFELIKDIASKFSYKQQFYENDAIAYNTAYKNGWLDEVCQHMLTNKQSVPQLMLREILEYVLGDKCLYNDRRLIKPYEIDILFHKYKLCFEYDGIYYHNDKDDFKTQLVEEKGYKLFIIKETNRYHKYSNFIKDEVIKLLPILNIITNKNINSEIIEDFKFVNKHYLTNDELEFIKGKKISEIKNYDKRVYNFIRKYGSEIIKEYDIILDKPIQRRYTKSLDEYLEKFVKLNCRTINEVIKIEKHITRVLNRYNLNREEFIIKLNEKYENN